MFIIKETMIALGTDKNSHYRQKGMVSVGYYGKDNHYFGNALPSKYALKDHSFTNKVSAQIALESRRTLREVIGKILGIDFTFEVLEVDAE